MFLEKAHALDRTRSRKHFVAALLQVRLVQRQNFRIILDGEDLLIMKEADIMGIIDKSEMGIIDKTKAVKKAA